MKFIFYSGFQFEINMVYLLQLTSLSVTEVDLTIHVDLRTAVQMEIRIDVCYIFGVQADVTIYLEFKSAVRMDVELDFNSTCEVQGHDALQCSFIFRVQLDAAIQQASVNICKMDACIFYLYKILCILATDIGRLNHGFMPKRFL